MASDSIGMEIIPNNRVIKTAHAVFLPLDSDLEIPLVRKPWRDMAWVWCSKPTSLVNAFLTIQEFLIHLSSFSCQPLSQNSSSSGQWQITQTLSRIPLKVYWVTAMTGHSGFFFPLKIPFRNVSRVPAMVGYSGIRFKSLLGSCDGGLLRFSCEFFKSRFGTCDANSFQRLLGFCDGWLPWLSCRFCFEKPIGFL